MTRRAPARSLSALSRRAASSLLLALAFTGQLAALFHMGLVHHDVCADHGELVEPSRDHDRTLPSDSVLARTPGGDEGDEHCLATSMTQSFGATRASMCVDTFTASAAVPIARAHVPAVEMRALALLDVAPKHGPPHLDV